METLDIFDIGERFPCLVRRLITCQSHTLLGISRMRDIMSEYLVDDIFIRVFHCIVQRHDICGVMMEGFEMSNVGVSVLLSNQIGCSIASGEFLPFGIYMRRWRSQMRR